MRRSSDLASLDAGRETLAEFVDEWWRLDASSRPERATQELRLALEPHILPRLGQTPVRDITPLTVTRFRADLEQAGVWGRDDPTLSRSAPEHRLPTPSSASGSAPSSSSEAATMEPSAYRS